jgi:hypothetical protein
MGLAPYGKPNPNIKIHDGRFNNRSFIKPNFPAGNYVRCDLDTELTALNGNISWHDDPELVGDYRKDLAYAVQKSSEQRVFDLIRKTIELTGMKKIVMAGGYWLNCVANYELLKEFPNISNVFHSFEKGEHKADLFRYYFLYVKGGVFVDSDAMIQVDLDSIVRDYEFFSVHSKYINPTSIFQGFIGCTPKNKIIYEALKDIYTINPKELKDYFIIVKHLYTIVQQYKHLYDTKLYVEKWNIKPNTKNKKYCESFIFDDDEKITLLIHYPCNSTIP